MLATSAWNPLSLWKGVERVNIYLMIFLAVAMLAIPLVQPQEAEGGLLGPGLALLGIGLTIVLSMCPASQCYALVGSAHSMTCYNDHNGKGWAQFYSCQKDKKWIHGSCEQN